MCKYGEMKHACHICLDMYANSCIQGQKCLNMYLHNYRSIFDMQDSLSNICMLCLLVFQEMNNNFI